MNVNLQTQFLSFVHLKDENQVVKPWIEEIAKTLTGRQLLNRFLKIGRQFEVVSAPLSKTFVNMDLIKIETETPYLYVTKKNGIKHLVEGPKSARFAHELIHLIHGFEDLKRHDERNDACTRDGTTNEEERLTIFGKNNQESDACNESSLLEELGFPPRCNHDGPSNPHPTLIDVIKVGAIGTLKETVEKDHSKYDFVGYCCEAQETTSLLSAASYYGQDEIIEYLLSCEAKINQEDEIGGPILAALKNGHKELALTLAKRGMNTELKDKNGRTALDYINDRPTSRFDSRTKPLIEYLNHFKQV